ncbi:MAG: SDR family oxidoreductase [Caldilineaceae bacterium]|nr:SDR family oxidoreductase [Caldilineaceae bacterium]MBP8123065.1 SDR family oxidoreductase [Caldilineaceae bacterium]MBP9073396.1 SDR family oxidoreductase [Caldilineaceae bacterium]
MKSNLCDLSGKLVLVTGAGTGIGRGVALVLAEMGADVALHYGRSADGALAAVEQIRDWGRRATVIQGDLSVVADCRRVVDEAAAFLGGLDGLVNNAGITTTIDFQDVTEEQFNRVYNLNIRGEFFCAQQAVGHMLERGRSLRERDPEMDWAGGSIVNISSVHGMMGCPGHSVYAGTKGAINAFTRELAVELTSLHIRANVLAPGTIEVPSYWRKSPDYTREAGNNSVPWGRVGLPEEVGYLAAYLLSDASEFMTGSVLYFDGGLTAKMALPEQSRQSEG